MCLFQLEFAWIITGLSFSNHLPSRWLPKQRFNLTSTMFPGHNFFRTHICVDIHVPTVSVLQRQESESKPLLKLGCLRPILAKQEDLRHLVLRPCTIHVDVGNPFMPLTRPRQGALGSCAHEERNFSLFALSSQLHHLHHPGGRTPSRSKRYESGQEAADQVAGGS